MRQFISMLVLLLLTAASFGGCAREAPTFIDGTELVFSDDNKTILYGGQSYSYQCSDRQIRIEYPNGYMYTKTFSDNAVTSVWGTPFDAEGFMSGTELGYLDEEMLAAAVKQHASEGRAPEMLFPALLLMGVGLWQAVTPKTAWYLSYGWRFKNAEPSDAALGAGRVVGIGMIILGLILIFV